MEKDNGVLGLATIRSNRGVTLEQIAQSTKISMHALRAIEGGEFKKLPGGIYDTNYIRQYAMAIDFDPGMLLDYYYRKTGGSNAPDTGQKPSSDGKSKGTWGGLRRSAILGL